MIDADIRGKLRPDGSNAHERSEDLLTSTVFGLLRYLPVGQAIVPLMHRVRPAALKGRELTIQQDDADHGPWMDLSAAATCDIEFWPSFGLFGQPDLLLVFRDAAQIPVHLVVVEAKLYSPKSGEADVDVDEADIDSDADEPAWNPDQLVRYWRGVLQHVLSPGTARCSVVYLTAHATPPVEDLAASLRGEHAMRLGWLSWRDIWHVTSQLARQPQPPLAAADLTRLLANRGFKALDSFKSSIPLIPETMRFWRRKPWFHQLLAPGLNGNQHFWEAQ